MHPEDKLGKMGMEGMGACTHWNFQKSAPMPVNQTVWSLNAYSSKTVKATDNLTRVFLDIPYINP